MLAAELPYWLRRYSNRYQDSLTPTATYTHNERKNHFGLHIWKFINLGISLIWTQLEQTNNYNVGIYSISMRHGYGM